MKRCPTNHRQHDCRMLLFNMVIITMRYRGTGIAKDSA
jgi:hypothetical protein